LKLGGSKARALLGGVAAVAVLGVVASEVGAGPASAAREQSRAESAKPHWVRPAAAILQKTPLSLAGDLAAERYRSIAIQRYAIARYVAGVEAAKAQEAADAAAAAAAAEVRGARVTRNSAPSPDYSGAVPTDGEHGDTLACIRAHESDSAGGYSAVNSSSGAGGAYQALPSTWDGYAGYARAQDAPPEIQDQWAREAIAASGTRPWAGSGC
jgi:Transglycosylase-like domain